MQRKIIQYQLIATSAACFDSIVDNLLRQGYELYGNPFSHKDYCCQAVVKYEEISEHKMYECLHQFTSVLIAGEETFQKCIRCGFEKTYKVPQPCL